MADELSLARFCRVCGSKCCRGRSGFPRIDVSEKVDLSFMLGMDRLHDESGYCVPVSHDGACNFLDTDGLCRPHMYGMKPTGCQLYPLVPRLEGGGAVAWLIDRDCMASTHLTPEFYAEALVVGMDWIRKVTVPVFEDYWSKYRADNSEQDLVSLESYMAGDPRKFARSIKTCLERKPGMYLKKWLEKNNAMVSLGFIVAEEATEKTEAVRIELKYCIDHTKNNPKLGKTERALCFRECVEHLLLRNFGELTIEEFSDLFIEELESRRIE